jgi:putative transposase
MLARENAWGYTRILGELKKLRIRQVSATTVRNILKEAGLEPGPRRGEGTWDEFLKQHAASLWQCDFFSQKIVTVTGFRQVFMLAFLHVQTRRVILSPATFNPDEAWVVAQAEAFIRHARQQGLPVRRIIHDRDTKYTKRVNAAFQRQHVQVVRIAYRAPNMQAYVERFIGSVKYELLHRFVILGVQHFKTLTREYLEYYHQHRPHQGVGNELLVRPKRKPGRPRKVEESVSFSLSEIKCEKRLGGLLKS